MRGLSQRFAGIFSSDAIIVSKVGPKDPYEHDRFWDLIEHRWLWAVPLVMFCVAGVVALPYDIEVSKWFLQENAPHWILELADAAEPFGDGTCVIIFCIAMYLVDRARRRDLLLVIVASQGAGMVTNVIKIAVNRVRPASFTFDAPVSETFGPWFDFDNLSSSYQSFPSGHTTTAVGLAMALALIYPRAKILYFMLAVFVGVHRVSVGAHYMSDVFGGAFVGYTVGLICCRVHLWKWRLIGVVPPRPDENTGEASRSHAQRTQSLVNRPSDDGSALGAPDESSESVAK